MNVATQSRMQDPHPNPLPRKGEGTGVAVIVGSAAEPGGEVRVLPGSDRAAIVLATRLKQGKVHAYCLREDADALRYALAAGAASAAVLGDLEKLDAGLILIGGAGSEPWGDLLAATLAEKKSCAMVLEVIDVRREGEELLVTRTLGRGAREVVRVQGPAVLAISEEAPRLHYVSHYRRMRASLPRGAAAGALGDPAAGISGPWEATRLRVKTGNLAAKTGGAASDRMNMLMGATSTTDAPTQKQESVITADPATCAQHLLRYLSFHGFIDKQVSAPVIEPAAPLKPAPSGPAPAQLPTTPPPSARANRGVRPLEGPARGAARRPVPVPVTAPPAAPPPAAPTQGKLARAPRPVEQAAPTKVRGPFPVGTKGPAVSANMSPPSRLARGPRPRGQAAPANLRGPRPITDTALPVVPPKGFKPDA